MTCKLTWRSNESEAFIYIDIVKLSVRSGHAEPQQIILIRSTAAPTHFSSRELSFARELQCKNSFHTLKTCEKDN